MKKTVELPLIEPIYSTYHNGLFSALIVSNPSIRNWYLNNALMLVCNRKFLTGYTTPEINVIGTSLSDNPYLEQKWVQMRFLNGYILPVIRNFIDQGYYVYFSGVDDYYVEGKSWYGKRHFNHDGGICGYNQENKTFCMYAYDSNWIYRKFWTSQKSFEAGRRSAFKREKYGKICGIKPKKDIVKFSPSIALTKIAEYLDSTYEKYPEDAEGNVYGIVVHDYISRYIDKLIDSSIPYERMDRRVMRMIWEHKKVMHERIECVEKALKMDQSISVRYKSLVTESDNIRMLYASHHLNRRDSMLPIIRKKLLSVKEKESELLGELLEGAAKI